MIESSYTTGPNISVVSNILGAYWRVAFQSQALIGAVCRTQGTVLDYNEMLERNLLTWLDEQRAGYLGRTIRVATIPPEDITLRKAVIGEGLSIGGGGVAIGQPSSRVAWNVNLPFALTECPFIGALPDKPLLTEGIDYTLTGPKTLSFNRDPYSIGFREVLTVASDGTPSFAPEMVFIACIPEGYTQGYASRYGRYKVKESARNAVFDLLVQEASITRIIKAVMSSLGAKMPSVFEETDETGSFTWIKEVIVEGDNTLLPTSGGELAVIPTMLGPLLPSITWKHRPGDSLCAAVTITEGNPPELAISVEAVALLKGDLEVFRAVRDALPAGNPLQMQFSTSFSDTPLVTVEDSLVPFIVYQHTETVSVTCDDITRSRSHL